MDGLRAVFVSRRAVPWQGARLARSVAALVALAVVAAGGALGRPSPVAAQQHDDPLASVEAADPLELGRRAAALGDDAVVARLSDATPAPVRLAAIRAARFLRRPERALGPLARVARGRDPDLAPAAARSLSSIVESLDLPEVDRRELRADDFAEPLRELRALAADARARADVRAVARRVTAKLLELLGPAAR